ncbi:brassinosteroid LRR receptor kinase [Cryptomeria japonica]|uniref:brassinosteroid LRR receptor kinase n=1 Tax=Cryptomeria japonica TaxID=3369 RepID=UPI0027DA919C|nr:brassinosteroid LRR receptor kinase [Cryptomeria japonica]
MDAALNSDPCQWDRVKCSENKDNVVKLNLSGLEFYESTWQFVCKLPTLEFLDLSKNNLSTPSEEEIGSCINLVSLNLSYIFMSGTLPSLNRLQKLQSLDISHSNFEGGLTAQIQNLRELKTVIAAHNNFNGSVAFGSLKLEKVDVSYNHLSGGFPHGLTKCTNLTYLALKDNSFSGPIPDDISGLAKLETLVLSFNSFSGSIPDGLSSIAGLEYLDLSYNKLSGSIPLEVFCLSNLKTLYLTSNLLSGNIAQNFSRNLIWLSIDNNNLTGNIPSTISNAPNLTGLEMNNNFLNGPIPEQLASCTKLRLLNLGHNRLGGLLAHVLPKLLQLQYLKLPNNEFRGSILDKLSNLSRLTYLDLSNNYLDGTITRGTDYSNMKLSFLNLSHISLEGRIPTPLLNLINLETLDLSNNRLTGEIPESLSYMFNLQALNLSNNELTGRIPQAFKNNIYIGFTLNVTGNPGLFQEQSNRLSTRKKKPSVGLLAGVAVAGSLFTLGVVVLTILACKYFRYSREHEISEAQQERTIKGLFILLLGFLGLNFHRHRFDLSEAIDKILQKVEHPRISYEELLEATNRFHKSNLLATNSFGSVYKGILADGTPVAVKVLNLMHEESDKIFKAECKVLQKARHRNLARIITTCSNHDFKALIFEFFPKGSLEKHLYQHSCRLGLRELLSIAIDIAFAVEYLHHDCYVQIVHCDIKPSNVLLDESLTAHLSDFGISRLLSRTAVNSATSTIDLRGSVGYIAPEYGLGCMMSPRGDVYSYGILLLEMLTRKRPTDSLFDGALNLHKWVKRAFPDRSVEVADKNLLVEGAGQKNAACVISLMRVGLLCSADSPEARPTMRDVSNLLQEIQQDLTTDTTTPMKLMPTISNLVSDTCAILNYEDASETPSSSF